VSFLFSRHLHFVLLAPLLALALVLAFGLRSAPPETRIVIRYAYWGGTEQQAVAHEIADAFEKSHPGIRIEREFVSWSSHYWRKLTTQIPAGVAPDVWFLEPNVIPDYASRGDGGVLLALDELIRDDPDFDLDGYYAAVTESFRYKGKLYCLPSQFSTVAIFYNKRLFDRCDLPYPDGDWDWDEFLETAKALTRDTDGDEITDTWGFSGGGIHPERGYGNFIWAAGGRFLSEDRERVIVADETKDADGRSNFEKVEEGLRFVLDMCYKHKVMPPLGSGALGGRQQWESFAADKLGLTIGAAYHCNMFNSDPGARDSYGVVPLPSGPRGGRGSAMICRGHAINAKLKRNPEKRAAAWKFVRFCSSREAQEIIARRNQDIPALKSVAEDPAGPYLKSDDPPANKEIFLAPVREGYAHDIFATRGYYEWWGKAFRPVMAKIFRRDKTIRRGLREIQKIGNRIIEEAEDPPEYRRSSLAWFPPLLLAAAVAVCAVVLLRRARARKTTPGDRPRLADFLGGMAFIAPNFLGFLVFVSFPVAASFFLAFCEWDLLSAPRWAGFRNFDLLLTQGAGESGHWLVGASGTWLAVNLPRALAAAAVMLAALFLVVSLANSRALAARSGAVWAGLLRFWPVVVIVLAFRAGGRPDLLRTFFAFHRGAEDATIEWEKLVEITGMHAAAAGGLPGEGARRSFAWDLTKEFAKADPPLSREELVGGWNARLADAVVRSLSGERSEEELKVARKSEEDRFRDEVVRALEHQWQETVAPWAARLRAEAARSLVALHPGTREETSREFAGRFLDALLGVGAGLDGPEDRDEAAGRIAAGLGIIPADADPSSRREFAREFLGRFEGRFLGPLPVVLSPADAILAAAVAVQLLLLLVPFFGWRENPGTWGRRGRLFLASFSRTSRWLLLLVLFVWLCDALRLASLVSVMRLPGDQRFWFYLYNTVFLMLALPVHMLMSLSLALLVNRKLRGIYVYRVVYFLPSITAGVAVYIWWWIYNNNAGLLNQAISGVGEALDFALAPLGLEVGPWRGRSWLDSPFWAKPALMMMSLWISAGGFHMILYLAGLQGIDPQLYEAARIDGAGKWQQFRHITWPMLSPTTFFILVMGIIHGLEGGFEQAYVMTHGGPGESTTTLSYYIFNNAYQWFNMGYAAAIAWVLFFLVFVATIINWRYAGRRVEY